MADIFISYSKQDRALVEELDAFLRECGFTVWWDTALVAGKDFRQEIHRQIDASAASIVVWTKHSRQSDFVIDEADVARRQDKLISALAGDLASDAVPLGFRTAHHIAIEDAEGLLQALAKKGLAPAKPVSSYVLRLFKRQLGTLAKPRRRYIVPAALALLLIVAGLAYAWLRQDSADARPELQFSTGSSSDGSKSYLTFYIHPTSRPGRRGAAEQEPARVLNIDVLQFDRDYRQTDQKSARRTFILPPGGYEYKFDMADLRGTLERKGIIALCVTVSFDKGKTSERIGKLFPVEAAQQYSPGYYDIKFDAPDDALINAVTRATDCRYVF
jgi:hypothetical protein